MKKYILIPLIALAFGCSSAQTLVSPATQKPKVYFIRVTVNSGIFGSMKAFIDDKIVCNLNNNKYSIHEVEPGNHKFTIQNSGKKAKAGTANEAIFIEMEAGKTYYVTVQYQTSGFNYNLYCQETTENSAKVIMAKCELDNCL